MSAKKSNRTKGQKRHWFKTIIIAILGLVLIGEIIFFVVGKQAPELTQGKLQNGGSSVILDYQGNEVASLGDENRDYTTSNDFSTTMKDAVVSIEDRRFYQEPLGINPVRIVKAAFYNLTHPDAPVQGGSTLTQQLVKLSVFSTKKSDQTLKRKIQEAYLTIHVERNYSKQQILEFYMNKVYLANGVYGMGTASDYYFNKKPTELTLAQAALIAGLPQAPNNYDPYTHPEAAQQRRDQVIDAMLANKKITSNEAQTAKQTAVTDGLVDKRDLDQDNNNRYVADNFIKEVISDVQSKGYDPYQDNLKIKTTLHLDVQKQLYEAVNEGNLFPDNDMQVAATIVDPDTGSVVAMIGGRKQGKVLLGLNRATQKTRSNGSTMKPILDYGPAIEYLNWSTYHLLKDTAYTYPGTDIALQNWDHRYKGTITMRDALVDSRNIPAVRTLESVGLSKARSFAKNLGITIDSDQGLSVGIGGDVSTLQVASAYGAFANSGTYQKPIYVSQIQTADGMTHTYQSDASQAMKKSTAYMITDMLKDVITDGTGTNAKLTNSGVYQAGKTGTVQYSDDELAKNASLSNTAKDAWFAGYTKSYSMAVWVGYDQPQKNGLSSSDQQIPLYLYKRIMSNLATASNSSNWHKPSSVVSERIVTGSNPPTITNATVNSTLELFVKGHQPTARISSSSRSSSRRYSQSNTPTIRDDEDEDEDEADEVTPGTTPGAAASSSSSTNENNNTTTQNPGSGTTTTPTTPDSNDNNTSSGGTTGGDTNTSQPPINNNNNGATITTPSGGGQTQRP